MILRLFAASFLLSLLVPVVALAHDGSFVDPAAFLIVEEEDASPSCGGTMIKVTNATLTDNGDGTCSIATGGTATTGWTDDGASVSLTTNTDNVSIGTDTAGGKLFIDGDTDEIQLQVQGNATQTTNVFEIENSAAANLFTVSGVGVSAFQTSTDSTTGFQVLDANGGTPVINVDTTNERVEIGAATSTSKLTISGSGVGGLVIVNTAASATNGGAGIQAHADDNAAMASGHRLAFYTFGGSVEDGTTKNGAAIVAFADELWTDTSIPARLEFETAPSGSITRLSRATIDSNGNFGVGTDSPDFLISVVGHTTDQTIGMDRTTDAGESGFDLLIVPGGADAGSTNLNGGDLVLGGSTEPLATGNGENKIQFSVVNSGQGTGTTDRTPTVAMQIDESHLEFTDTAPAVSSCGTTPSIDAASTDQAGKVTAGTGTATTCTLTFSVPAYTNAPACFCSNETTEQTLKCVSTTTTLVISSATDFAGDVIAYGCLAFE